MPPLRLEPPHGDGDVANGDHVVVTDISMPFSSMVVFILKWTLASIPAAFVIALIALVLMGIFGGIMAGIFAAMLGTAGP